MLHGEAQTKTARKKKKKKIFGIMRKHAGQVEIYQNYKQLKFSSSYEQSCT